MYSATRQYFINSNVCKPVLNKNQKHAKQINRRGNLLKPKINLQLVLHEILVSDPSSGSLATIYFARWKNQRSKGNNLLRRETANPFPQLLLRCFRIHPEERPLNEYLINSKGDDRKKVVLSIPEAHHELAVAVRVAF